MKRIYTLLIIIVALLCGCNDYEIPVALGSRVVLPEDTYIVDRVAEIQKAIDEGSTYIEIDDHITMTRPLVINANVGSIEFTGSGVLDGNHVSRIFVIVNHPNAVVISGSLELCNGRAPGLDKSNALSDDFDGGAIFIKGGSISLRDNVVIKDCVAANGGAIGTTNWGLGYLNNTIILDDDVRIKDNFAVDFKIGSTNIGGKGGAVFMSSDTYLIAKEKCITGNAPIGSDVYNSGGTWSK